jgi:DUF1680 family protein
MSKKTFRTPSGGIGSLLGEATTKVEAVEKLAKKVQALKAGVKSVGRPRTNLKEVGSESERGTLLGETRATFIVNIELLEKIKAIAYQDRKSYKAVLHRALADLVESYEKKNGKGYLKAYKNRSE